MSKILRGPCSRLSARVDVPASKSLTNRALIAAAAAGGGRVCNPLDCEDTRLLAKALSTTGWQIDWGRDIVIGTRGEVEAVASVDLGNSGTGARLLIGLLAATPGRFVVDGTSRLRERPMLPLLDALGSLGARVEGSDGGLPVFVQGSLMKGGRVDIRPETSSQFVSSLLLAGTLMTGGLDLSVEGELPSRPYVDLTLDVMSSFGVEVEHATGSRQWRVPPGAAPPHENSVGGGRSAAAFLGAAAAVVGGEVDVGPLQSTSHQGDRAVCAILEEAGVEVTTGSDRTVFRGPAGRSFRADLRDTPDLFPALVVVAAAVPPGSELTGLDHLRHKESDRFSVMVSNLERLGCEFQVGESSCKVVRSLDRVSGPPPDATAADDHRIAMAMAVAALAAGPVRLDNTDCVAKSFPGFWGVWDSLLAQTGEGGHHP
jgi:3-phosphoshikimate 1-carboxyvinyltransferase